MSRRAFLVTAAAAFALSASLAYAGEEKKEDKKEEKGKGKGDVGQYVDLQPVALPIVFKGQLVNYIFVYVRLNLTSGANTSRLREKEPYFRDALVRAGHRTPFTVPTDLSKIDVDRLCATLKQEATTIAGSGQIASVVVTSQAPRRRVATPSA